MLDKSTLYSDLQSAKWIRWLTSLVKTHCLDYVLLTALISVYFFALPLMYTHMGALAGTFVSIPVIAFAYIKGLRYGLMSWLLLGVAANGVFLALLGAANETAVFTQGQITGQTVLLVVTVMIGRMRDLATDAIQQAERRTRKLLADLEDTNQALNAEVAQHKCLIAEFQTNLDKQKRLTEFKSRMGMMTSHEFRTPLSLILTSSEILRHSFNQLTGEQQQRYFDTIHKQVDQLTALADDIMSLAKAETETHGTSTDFLDIESVCDEIIMTFRVAHQSTHTFCFGSTGVFREVQIDRKFAHQIITNLLSNAVKYSPSGGEISLTLSFEENKYVICVQDQGVGIPEEDLGHLFDLFHRGHNADIAPGTGLGLVIVKQAVEAHSGTIQVESKLGIGTTFAIQLPRFHEPVKEVYG